MRHYQKKQEADYPSIFVEWLSENRSAINEWVSSEKKGDEIWDEFGKTFSRETETQICPTEVRNKLLDALYEEQNGLCCYCGNKVERKWDESKQCWKYSHYAIEHFRPKNHYKNLIFDYCNLLLTCKESSKIKQFEIGKQYKGVTINSIADIARLTAISELKILEQNRQYSFIVGNKITLPNPPHCDDSKSVYDSRAIITEIVDPSLETHIEHIERFTFLRSGEIDSVRNNISDEIIENSIDVLKLNCETLKDRRKNKWDNVERYFTENMQYLMGDADLLRASIDKLIVEKAVPNSDNELGSFYFVEVAFYKNLFNSLQ